MDPATRSVGAGLVRLDGSQITYVDAWTITAPAKLERPARVGIIGRELLEIIREHRPDVIAYETGFGGPRSAITGALGLGEARGALYLAAELGGRELGRTISVRGFAPATVKAAVARGNASKAEVAAAVRLVLGMRREAQSDCADALAVAYACAVELRTANAAAMLLRAQKREAA